MPKSSIAKSVIIPPLTHAKCRGPVTIATLHHDVALYVYCEKCHDIVEDGELMLGEDILTVDQINRGEIRLTLTP